MAKATLSGRNQIVIRREAREALGLEAADKLLVVVRGDSIIVLPEPKPYSIAIRGLGRRAYPKNYLEKERRSWD